MRNRVIVLLIFVIGLGLWFGLVALMNRRPPDATHQALFLAMLGGAVGCTTVPLSYLTSRRLSVALDSAQSLRRALRQGLLFGVLAAVLMTLRLIRVLNILNGVILVLVVVTVEVLIAIKQR